MGIMNIELPSRWLLFFMEPTMKTMEEILAYESSTLDGRDLGRLAIFMTKEQLTSKGMTPKNPDQEWVPQEFTREAVLKCLQGDLAFAFEKALDKRGLSASMMYHVIKMWMWVLDEHEDLVNWPDDNYAQYGLPLFKAVALRYDLPNEIGDDEGDEFVYSSEADDY